MKANLGCGLDKREGYVNCDIRFDVKPDVVFDMESAKFPFRDGCFDEILLKDVIEHMSFRRVEDVLKAVYICMKSGARAYIQCPDLEAIAKKVILSGKYDWHEISYWVYGGQEYKENAHKSGFTIPTLKKLLEKIGFRVLDIRNDGGTNIMCWIQKP